MRLGTLLVALCTAIALQSPMVAEHLSSPAETPHAQPLVWQNRGQAEPFGAGLAVAASDDIVAISAQVCDDASVLDCNWFVRAIDARTGVTRWEDRVNAGGSFEQTQSVSVDSQRVIASGWFNRAPLPNGLGRLDFVVRAYEAKTGALIWQQRIDRGRIDIAEQMTVSDGRVFTVGRVRGASDNSDFAIFAFDAATGVILWESVDNLFQADTALSVIADQSTVFVTGLVRNFNNILVRAYDAQTGALRWQDEIIDGLMFIGGGAPNRMAAAAGTLYLAAGILNQTGDSDCMVRAYDERTGSLRWSRQWDSGGTDEAFGIAAQGNQLFTVGEEAADQNFLGGFRAVRAMDRLTGEPQWQDLSQLAPGGDAFATSVLVSGDLVFTGAWSQNAAADYTWSLRAYERRSGALRLLDEGDTGAINALSGHGGRVYASGFLGSLGGSDLLVRAYRPHPGD